MSSKLAIAQEHRGLMDIDEVRPFDSQADQPIFDEIRSVLARYGALNRFGITLLHKHFDVFEGERMVEVSDRFARTLSIRPVREGLRENESYVETNWRFDVSSGSATQVCFADCLRSGGGSHHNTHKKR